jgi:hypothetical protein
MDFHEAKFVPPITSTYVLAIQLFSQIKLHHLPTLFILVNLLER